MGLACSNLSNERIGGELTIRELAVKAHRDVLSAADAEALAALPTRSLPSRNRYQGIPNTIVR
jgi:hypothetical protein